MRSSRLLMAFIAMGCLPPNAQALPINTSVPTDRAGRPLVDEQGRQLDYETPTPPEIPKQRAAGFPYSTVPLALNGATSAVQFNTQWTAKVFGTHIGTTGLRHIDINNDGIEEMVFASNITSSNGIGEVNGLTVLSYRKIDNTWSISRQNPVPLVTALHIYRDKNNKAMLAYGTVKSASEAAIRIINLADGALAKEIVVNTLGHFVNEILVGDADNDGGAELIAVTSGASYFYNLDDYSASGSIAYGGTHAAVGNVDGDTAIELIYNGGKVVSYKNAKAMLEWNYTPGFGEWVHAANIDADAADEIIGADKSGGYFVHTFDADIKSLKWDYRSQWGIDALHIADINNDGTDDIVYGDRAWGSLHALDQNGSEFWSLANPSYGITGITLFDANGDGDQDIAWGVGNNSSDDADYLYIHDVTDKKQLFQSAAIDPLFRTVAFGDTDNDGKKDFITVSQTSKSRRGNGIIQVLDADTGVQKWQSESYFLSDDPRTELLAAAVGDVDNDGLNELVVVGEQLYAGAIYLVDVKNRKLKKTIILDQGSPLNAVKIADIDGDGQNDIIVSNTWANSGSPGYYVYVVNGATGAIKWHSQNLADVFGLDIADIDGNGNQDIVVSGKHLFIFDGVTHANSMSVGSNYTGIATIPLKGKPSRLVIAGTRSGRLQVFTNDLSFPKADYYTVCSKAIGAVEMLTNSKVLVACGNYLKLFDLPSKTVIWTSIGPIARGSYTDALAVTKVNGELKVGAGGSLSRLLRYVPAL